MTDGQTPRERVPTLDSMYNSMGGEDLAVSTQSPYSYASPMVPNLTGQAQGGVKREKSNEEVATIPEQWRLNSQGKRMRKGMIEIYKMVELLPDFSLHKTLTSFPGPLLKRPGEASDTLIGKLGFGRSGCETPSSCLGSTLTLPVQRVRVKSFTITFNQFPSR